MKRFRKTNRLRKNREFSALYKQGKKFTTEVLIFITKSNNKQEARLGVSIAKRSLKLSVKRNLVKRLNKEHFRDKKNILGNIDIVTVGRQRLGYVKDNRLRKVIKTAWNQFIKYQKRSY